MKYLFFMVFSLILWFIYDRNVYNPFKDKNVIIVGNSKELLNRPLGEEIDKFDVVVRINNFEIDGYEKYAGTKTDAFHMNYISIPKEHIQNVLSSNDIVWMGTRNIVRFTYRAGLNILDKRIQQYASGDYVCKNPTSGTMVLSTLMRQCNRPVTIVGLGGYSEPGYYYDENPTVIDKNWKTAHNRHCPEIEQEFIENAIIAGKVKRLSV